MRAEFSPYLLIRNLLSRVTTKQEENDEISKNSLFQELYF